MDTTVDADALNTDEVNNIRKLMIRLRINNVKHIEVIRI